jgi:hypothetical protein
MFGRWGRGGSGSHEAADIADWVQAHYSPRTIDHVQVYDLTASQRDS